MAFTEFVCRNGGSNLNGGGVVGGTEPGTGALYTCTNSNWDGTSVFTPTDGSTPANTVTVGDFASVYLDAATVAVYVARVTIVAAGVNGAITLSTTAASGTAPGAGATGRTIKVGGAWKGPNAAESFPFGFVTNALTDAGGSAPRINLKNDATYAITAAMTHANNGPIRWQGYTTNFQDGGRATIDGTIVGASYVLLTLSGTNNDLVDVIFQNNGTTGSAIGVVASGNECLLRRVVVNSVRGHGINISGSNVQLVESEIYAANQSNTASTSGVNVAGVSANVIRTICHDNTGSNTLGMIASSFGAIIGCILDTNGADGIRVSSTSGGILKDCEFYNNGSDGIEMTNGSAAILYIENCNFIKNTGWGINGSGAGTINGTLINCGFGSGTQVNGSGATTGTKSMVESGTVNYVANVTPWVDPANGDFRINLAAAINTGRGTFTQTAGGYAGTVGYPDIGAAQHLEVAGALIRPVAMNGGMV